MTTFRITRTEVIGELSSGGKGYGPALALGMIAGHVEETKDTTGSYSVEFPHPRDGGQTTVVSVDLFTKPQEYHGEAM